MEVPFALLQRGMGPFARGDVALGGGNAHRFAGVVCQFRHREPHIENAPILGQPLRFKRGDRFARHQPGDKRLCLCYLGRGRDPPNAHLQRLGLAVAIHQFSAVVPGGNLSAKIRNRNRVVGVAHHRGHASHLLRHLIALGDVHALGNGGHGSLPIRGEKRGRVPEDGAPGPVNMLDVDLDRLPAFAGLCLGDEFHRAFHQGGREENFDRPPNDFVRAPAGQGLEGAIETRDAELRIPDDDGGIGVIDQILQIVVRFPQLLLRPFERGDVALGGGNAHRFAGVVCQFRHREPHLENAPILGQPLRFKRGDRLARHQPAGELLLLFHLAGGREALNVRQKRLCLAVAIHQFSAAVPGGDPSLEILDRNRIARVSHHRR